MSLKQRIAARYQTYTLQRIQRQFKKNQQSKKLAKATTLRHWMLAADQIARSEQRLRIGLLTLLVSTPLLWFSYPLLQGLLADPPPVISTTKIPPAPKSTPKTEPTIHFTIQLQLDNRKEETKQILDKIKRRSLPIEIQPGSSEQPHLVTLVDTSPKHREGAEQLLKLYSQLFGVEGKIIERTIESDDPGRL